MRIGSICFDDNEEKDIHRGTLRGRGRMLTKKRIKIKTELIDSL